MVPSGYKEDTVYSVIPTDGSGDLTFTRASNGTRINSAGLVEVVPWNLVEYSEDFSNAAWTKTGGASITANDTTAPNGTLTADKINLASSIYSGAYQLISQPTGIYANSIYAKAGTFNYLFVLINGSSGYYVWFNLTTGTVGSKGSNMDGIIESVGNGWYRCTNIGTSNFTGNGRIFFYVYDSSGTKSYNGTSSNSLYIFGAQLETGSIATSYIPTTTGSVTRNADVISVSGAVSGSIGQRQGTIYCEFAYFGRPINRSGPLCLRQSAYRGMSINSDSINTGIAFGSSNDGGSTFITLVPGALQLGTYYKIAIGYDAGNTPAGGQQANGVVAYVNGVQVATGTLRVPDPVGLSEFRMYSANSGNDSEIPNIRIRAAALYTTRLTNAQLAALTTP